MTRKKAAAKTGTRIIIVSGLSGAGKSTALNAFEDMGFEAVDNLPISLLPELMRLDGGDNGDGEGNRGPLAIGIDSRTRAFQPAKVVQMIRRLRRTDDVEISLLFMDCDDETLAKRFSETRRRHPLAQDRPVSDGIIAERQFLGEMMEAADMVLDTTGNNIHDTRRRLTEIYAPHEAMAITTVVKSFGYGRGVPRDADLVFDVRFLGNPHYEEKLRPLTGRDKAVGKFVRDDPNYAPFVKKLNAMLLSLLPLYLREGKSYLTIAFGCTGGRHRSVYLAEETGKLLEKKGYRVNIVHRDAERN
ncbi:MAG: RNase adapter RapZ [Proteobacteria bacterium]|nr:RNase adapter RapZ [Pseudomonadota bacterium]